MPSFPHPTHKCLREVGEPTPWSKEQMGESSLTPTSCNTQKSQPCTLLEQQNGASPVGASMGEPVQSSEQGSAIPIIHLSCPRASLEKFPSSSSLHSPMFEAQEQDSCSCFQPTAAPERAAPAPHLGSALQTTSLVEV